MANKKDPKVDKVLPAHTKKVRDDWDKKRNGGNMVAVSNPHTNDTLLITRLEADGNVVRVWTGDYTEASPEFVIVNPPTQYIAEGGPVEDPMTAVAISILGAKK